MEQVFYRVHVRTVTVWCTIASINTRKTIEKFALISSIISLFFLLYLHYSFVGININSNCFLSEMNTNVTMMKSYDIINIHISRDWMKYHTTLLSDNILVVKQNYGVLIYQEFTNLIGLHYDETLTKDTRRHLDTRSILNSILRQFEESFQQYNNNQEDLSTDSTISRKETLPSESQSSSSSSPPPPPSPPSLPQFESLLYDRIYLYSSEKSYLMLPPDKRKIHNITTYDLILPATSQCFGIKPISFLVYNLIGYDTIMINLMNKIYEGKGQVYNVYSKQLFSIETFHTHYLPPIKHQNHQNDQNPSLSFNNTTIPLFIQNILSYLLYKFGLILSSIFLFFTMTTIVSYILNLTQSKMLKFTFLLQYHIQHNIPYGTVVFTHVIESLVFVPIMVGILFFLFEFFRDQLLSFLILSLIWTCEVYSVMR